MRSPDRLLVIRLGSLGDLLLASAALVNIRIARPGAEIHLLVKEKFLAAAKLLPAVDQIIPLERNWLAQLPILERHQYSELIDLHGNLISRLIRAGVPAVRTIQFAKERLARQRLLGSGGAGEPVRPTIDRYNDAVARIGVPIVAERPVIARKRPATTMPMSLSPCFVLAPSASHAVKEWGRDRFAELAIRLVRDLRVSVYWADIHPPEPNLSDQLAAAGVMLLLNRPLAELAEIIRSATGVIANDSGIMHLGSACGTPTIGLFGPTTPALGFVPRGLCDRVLQTDQPCRPCSLHGEKKCSRDRRYCLDDLKGAHVLEEAANLLAQQRSSRPAIFLDRDGTLIVNKHYLSDPREVEIIPGVAEQLGRAAQAGYRLVVISNQSGVARGLMSEQSVQEVNLRMQALFQEAGVTLDRMLYCPHHPTEGSNLRYRRSCRCRKPGPGLVEEAALDLNIDLRRSWVIGDSVDDLNLAYGMGLAGKLVRTGHGEQTAAQSPPHLRGFPVYADAAEAIAEILDNRSEPLAAG